MSLGLLGLWFPIAFVLGAIALWFYATGKPRHRGSVHTIRAGLSSGALTAAVLYPPRHNLTVRLWSVLWLAFAHFVYLWNDRWVRV